MSTSILAVLVAATLAINPSSGDPEQAVAARDMEANAIYAIAFAVYEDESCRWRTIRFSPDTGEAVCASDFQFWCPDPDPSRPCLARDLPDTIDLPRCTKRRAVRH